MRFILFPVEIILIFMLGILMAAYTVIFFTIVSIMSLLNIINGDWDMMDDIEIFPIRKKGIKT